MRNDALYQISESHILGISSSKPLTFLKFKFMIENFFFYQISFFQSINNILERNKYQYLSNTFLPRMIPHFANSGTETDSVFLYNECKLHTSTSQMLV